MKDIGVLELTMNIVLTYAHDLLNKRKIFCVKSCKTLTKSPPDGVMTSYQMKNAQTVQKEVEDTKDPLNDLDPLWKLK